MSDIVIKNIEIPKDNKRLALFIDKDGDVSVFDNNEFVRITDAIKLPPHGRLIDVGDIVNEYYNNKRDYVMAKDMLDALDIVPTILEASK